MLQVFKNSILAPLFNNNPESHKLVNYCNSKQIDISFFYDKARFVVIGTRTIKVPQKCLKSFENLYNWVINNINKELNF